MDKENLKNLITEIYRELNDINALISGEKKLRIFIGPTSGRSVKRIKYCGKHK